jgi:hypothetical protein
MNKFPMKTEKTAKAIRKSKKKTSGTGVGYQVKAYGDKLTICTNAECVMRKKANCSGFEGCPGFKGR